MVHVIAVVQAVRHSLPFGSGDQPQSDGDAPDTTSSRPAAPSDVYVELGVSPEEYIVELCRSHGGRMKQQAVVEQTGWAASSVSRLLSEMEDDGDIVRLPLGREKAIVLPDTLPETSAARSVHA